MGEISETMPNPNPQAKSTNPKKRKISEFEFCKVCKINQDQGQRHKYFPSHKKSLSIVFSKFQTKLSEIRVSLKNPSIVDAEGASTNRLWCVFCDLDIDELGSFFSCNNVINHLASKNHMKNLKHFLWKYGGGSDFVDKFRIKEADFAKWEKRCKSLKEEAESLKKAAGPSDNIHNELNYANTNSFVGSNFHSVKSSISNDVGPLQCYTNEYQVSDSVFTEAASAGLYSQNVTSDFPLKTYLGASSINSDYLTVAGGNLRHENPITAVVHEDRNGVANGRGKAETHENDRLADDQLVKNPNRSLLSDGHAVACPLWFGQDEFDRLNAGSPTVLGGFVSNSSKSKKLNPERVGAAWADWRKMQMEMEKRGELKKSEYDANFIPSIGRVWESCSRNTSRKKFRSEKQGLPKAEVPPEEPVKIHPYVSKRMQRDAGK